jgi:replication-associated recombination protein RarA
MFGQLLLHESTRLNLTAMAKQPPQGILLVGPEGVGKFSLATTLADSIVDHHTDIRVVSPDDKGTIAIDIIRGLYKATRDKQRGRQIVIIERADCMSIEAQNALLKLLEEPRAGLTFMMTTLQLESLLPTILSRIQRLSLQPLPDDIIRRFVVSKKPGIAQNDLSQLVFLAQGRPGIALALLEPDALQTQREHMQTVKQLLAAKPHERFVLIGKLASSRESCQATLSAMSRVVEIQLASTANPTQAKHWAGLSEAIEDSMQAISHNGNIRAQLLQLFSKY